MCVYIYISHIYITHIYIYNYIYIHTRCLDPCQYYSCIFTHFFPKTVRHSGASLLSCSFSAWAEIVSGQAQVVPISTARNKNNHFMIWQCVKTHGIPVVHIKIAGIYGCSSPTKNGINRYGSIPIYDWTMSDRN